MSTSQSDDVSSINAAQQPDDAYKWKAFAAIAISFTTMVMSMQMAFVALSAIAEDYGITLRSVTWVVIAQALTISALMLPMGRFADIIGRKRVHLIGLVLFAAGATGPLPPIKTTVVGAPPFAPAPTTAAFLSMIFWVARPRLGTRFHASASPVLDVDGAGR